MAKCNPIIEEKGTINPTQLKVLRKWEAQMNSESLGDFSKRYFELFRFDSTILAHYKIQF